MKKLKEFYHKFDVDSKKIFGDYIFQKNLFRFSFALIVMLLGMALLFIPDNTIYFNCPVGSVTSIGYASVNGCYNPFFEKCNQDVVPCDLAMIPAGVVYGEPLDLTFLQANFFQIVISIFAGTFFINHFKNNYRREK